MRRKRGGNSNQNRDENFLIVPSSSYRNLFCSLCLLDGIDVSFESLQAYAYCLTNSSLVFPNLEKKEKFFLKKNWNKIEFKVVRYFSHLCFMTVFTYSYENEKEVNQQKRSVKFVKKIQKKGLVNNRSSLENYLKDTEKITSQLENSRRFNLERLIRLNFAYDSELGRPIYGDRSKLKDVKDIDFLTVQKFLKKKRLDYLDIFVGYPEASNLLTFKKVYKPASKLFFHTNELKVNPRVRNLSLNWKFDNCNVYNFQYSKINSELSFLNKLVLFETVKVIFDLKEEDLILSYIDSFVSFATAVSEEEVFSKLSSEIEDKFSLGLAKLKDRLFKFDSIEEEAKFYLLLNGLNLSLDKSRYINLLGSLTLDNIKKETLNLTYLGSLNLKGDRK